MFCEVERISQIITTPGSDARGLWVFFNKSSLVGWIVADIITSDIQ